ncbi:proline racemase family protein, partial [Pseudoalteromonas spongiae]|uniref:proline racemase family protein n=1 Tax=Pseudoalteromonas spongiae TaxID=298657 RepID=UPI001270DBD9
AEASILFIETSGCLRLCGLGSICTITGGLEAGLIVPIEQGKLTIDVPAGQIIVEYQMTTNKVESVKMYKVEAKLAPSSIESDVPELGKLKLDIS